MARNEDKVMEFVTKELEKNPGAKTADLFEQAKRVDASIKELSLRQFNARFPLQVKRKKSGSKPGRKRRSLNLRRDRGTESTARDAIRGLFLKFAGDLTGAEEKKDLVKVLAGVDRYVDEAIAAAKKGERVR
jgi:hypothetical protein